MRRVLPQTEFAKWLKDFLPQIPTSASADWLRPVVSPDPSDPKLAHLDGLNLSRAWMLEGIVSALPPDDLRRDALTAVADAHRRAGLAAVTAPLRRRALARQLCSISHNAARYPKIRSDGLPAPKVPFYSLLTRPYNSAVSVRSGSRRGFSPPGVHARSCQQVCSAVRLPLKMLRSALMMFATLFG